MAESRDGARGSPTHGRELRARGKRTMHKLLDAGVTVFAERGYHQARVDDIVKVARTSHGTFYLYFANKEELFRALALDVSSEMMALADDLPDLHPDGQAALRAWLARFSTLYEHYGAVIRAWTEAEIGGSEFGRLGTDVLSEFSRVLADRVRAAAPPHIDSGVAGIALVAMAERFNYYVISGSVTVEPEALIDTLTAAWQAAIFGADSPVGHVARARHA